MSSDPQPPSDAMEGDPRASLHPDYFKTCFRVTEPPPEWPDEFVVISAYATTGEQWTEEENEQGDEDLYLELERLGVWFDRLTGYAPSTGHAEPSWAAELPFDVACELGQRFQQDAIFHVSGDVLSVARCEHPHGLVSIGSFRDRLDVVEGPLYERLSPAEDSPWAHLTTPALAATIDRHMRPEASSSPEVHLYIPVGDLTLEDAFLEAIPDEGVRKLAAEDAAEDGIGVEDVARLLAEVEDLGWVVECDVSDSMVSGVWGLSALAIGNRGYVCYLPDFGCTDQRSPSIVSAWAPAVDAEARRACIVSTYVRLWDTIGLPPFLGQWVRGEAKTLHAALLATLDDGRGQRRWSDVVARILLQGVSDLAPLAWSQIAGTYQTPEAWVSRTAMQLADPSSGLADRASSGGAHEDEREALAALYLATITRECRSILERAGRQWLGPVNEMVGLWQIGYAKDDGMIDDDRPATLILRPDGSFSWDPPPHWLAGSGTWGLELMESGQPKLRFESRDRRWSHFLVLHTMENVGTFFHWQRTRSGMVVFKDRILRGHLIGTEE